jgi:hypothetical protein
MSVRQHPGGSACNIAGGCPDSLARQGQAVPIWMMVAPHGGVRCFGRGDSFRRSSKGW